METIALPELTPGHEESALQNRYFRPDKLKDSIDLEKLNNLKDAVGAGTYEVRAEEVAGKLIDYMLLSWNRPLLPEVSNFAVSNERYSSKTASTISVDNLKPTG